MLFDNPSYKPLYYSFIPTSLTMSLFKAIPIGIAYKVIDDMGDFDISKRETQDEIVENTKRFFFRDVCISTTQRVIEHVIVAKTDNHFFLKMFKSIKQSSMKKTQRMTRWDASLAMFKTSIRCGFVYHLAVFAFEEMLMMFYWIRNSVKQQKNENLLNNEKEPVRRHRKRFDTNITLKTFSTNSVKNMIICVAAIIAEALGACLGTLCYPGNGTLLCDRLFGNCAYLLA